MVWTEIKSSILIWDLSTVAIVVMEEKNCSDVRYLSAFFKCVHGYSAVFWYLKQVTFLIYHKITPRPRLRILTYSTWTC